MVGAITLHGGGLRLSAVGSFHSAPGHIVLVIIFVSVGVASSPGVYRSDLLRLLCGGRTSPSLFDFSVLIRDHVWSVSTTIFDAFGGHGVMIAGFMGGVVWVGWCLVVLGAADGKQDRVLLMEQDLTGSEFLSVFQGWPCLRRWVMSATRKA